MTHFIGRSTEIPAMYEDVVRHRIRTLHREAERERLISQIRRSRPRFRIRSLFRL